MKQIVQAIKNGETILGIEFGSTRIKAVLTDNNHMPIASGSHDWENRLESGMWTYTLEDVWDGLRNCYQNLKSEVKDKYEVTLTKIGAMGFSAMMHGYMVFDKADELLVPFRTWRNSTTEAAAEILKTEFNYNIPQRWSVAHLYQAMLNEEEHVQDITFITTLAGYIHWQLSGEKVIGIGDASGMFPIDVGTKDFDVTMQQKFNRLVAKQNYSWTIGSILPKIMLAGECAGMLTEEGAKLLDPSGELLAGIPMCPPEGDAGTGMAATNSVAERTGNVSAGTSIFAMIVLEQELSKVYPEIDMVTTPDGKLVAMVHANNCTSDLNAWVSIFKEAAESFGVSMSTDQLFEILYTKALEGDQDCGGLLSYGFFSGEDIMGVTQGRPLFVRHPKSNFNIANFMRTHLYSTCGALKVGMNLLLQSENVKLDKLLGHGGLFKTKDVGQKVMAAAMNTPVYVMETAGEGGAWGIALLAAYMKNKGAVESLADYLANRVFGANVGYKMDPDPKDVIGFEKYLERYEKGIEIERMAIKQLV